ncbi:MAG: hypothetical protein ACRCSE_10685 [Vibrio sp.]
MTIMFQLIEPCMTPQHLSLAFVVNNVIQHQSVRAVRIADHQNYRITTHA